MSQSQSDGKFGHGYPEFSDRPETKQASCAHRFRMLSLFPHLVQINFQYLCNPVRNLFYVKPAACQNVAVFKLLVGLFKNLLDIFSITKDSLITFNPFNRPAQNLCRRPSSNVLRDVPRILGFVVFQKFLSVLLDYLPCSQRGFARRGGCDVYLFPLSKPHPSLILASPNNISLFELVPFFVAFRP